MKYKIITAQSIEELEENVQESIYEGWLPQGSIHSVCYFDGKTKYYQPMIYSIN